MKIRLWREFIQIRNEENNELEFQYHYWIDVKDVAKLRNLCGTSGPRVGGILDTDSEKELLTSTVAMDFLARLAGADTNCVSSQVTSVEMVEYPSAKAIRLLTK